MKPLCTGLLIPVLSEDTVADTQRCRDCGYEREFDHLALYHTITEAYNRSRIQNKEGDR